MARAGKRVMIVDIDPQGNTTSGLGINKADVKHCIYDLLMHERSAEEVLIQTAEPNLWVIPATIQLAGVEIELSQVISREHRLREAIRGVKDQFDYILIDCPPSLGIITLNALTAAQSILIPIQCEFYALEGLSQLLNTIRLVQRHLNKHLHIEGVLLTMYDARTNLSAQVMQEVKKYFRQKVYQTVIPRNIRLSEAPSHGKPILSYDPRSKGAECYLNLAKEVMMNGE